MASSTSSPRVIGSSRRPNGVFGNGCVLAPQMSEEQPNHCHLDQCFTRLHFSLVILTHSSVTRNPTECSLPHPSSGQNAEPTGAWLPLDHFKIPATLGLAPGGQFLASIRSIGPDLFETWVQWSESSEQASSTFPIVQI